jgi:hypothetical protein
MLIWARIRCWLAVGVGGTIAGEVRRPHRLLPPKLVLASVAGWKADRGRDPEAHITASWWDQVCDYVLSAARELTKPASTRHPNCNRRHLSSLFRQPSSTVASQFGHRPQSCEAQSRFHHAGFRRFGCLARSSRPGVVAVTLFGARGERA